MKWLVLIALLGCGRLRFDAVAADGDGGANDDGMGDIGADASPATPWVKFVSTASPSTIVKRVAIGPSHEVVITGESTGDVTIDTFMHSAVGPLDMFVAKFDGDGNRVWSQVHGGSAAVDGRDIGVTDSGEVFVHGLNTGNATFGSLPHGAGTGQDPVVVAHMPANGMVSALQFYPSTAANAQGRGIGVSGQHIVTSGSFEGGISVSSSTFPDQPGMASYIARFSPLFGWQKMFSSTTRVAANDIDTSSADSSCVGGDFTGTTTFATGMMLTPYALADGWLAKIGGSGIVQSVVRIGGAGNDRVDAVVEAADGDCIAVGIADFATVNFDAVTQRTSAGMYDAFVARYSPTGQLRWAHLLGGAEDDVAWGIDEGADGNIYITGFFTNTATFLGSMMTAQDTIDSFVLALTPGGQLVKLYQIGLVGEAYAGSIAVDTARAGFVIGGQYNLTTVINGVTSPNDTGGFVAMLPF